MSKNRILTFAAVFILMIVVAFSLAACEGGTNEKEIQLSEVSLRLVVGEEKEVKSLGADCELYVTDQGIASVDGGGKVKAGKSRR